MKVTIRGELPDLNQIVAASKVQGTRAGRRWYRYAEMKRRLEEDVVYQIRQQAVPPVVEYPAALEFRWFCRSRRKDPDNISSGGRKIILDAFVAAGVLRNDGWKDISGFRDTFDVDAPNPRVEVHFEPVVREANPSETNPKGDAPC